MAASAGTNPAPAFAELEAALDHYNTTGNTLTRRIVDDWIADVRANYKETTVDWYRELDGYSREGAISQFVYERATFARWPMYEFESESPTPTAAENEGVIYYRTPESVIDIMIPLVEPPLRESEQEIEKARMRECLQLSCPARQRLVACSPNMPETIPWPDEYMHLLSLTSKIKGPGIAAYTGWTAFWPGHSKRPLDECYTPERLSECFQCDIAAYWKITGTENDVGEASYCAYCRPRESAALEDSGRGYQWRVLRRSRNDGLEDNIYPSLAHYLRSEAGDFEAALRLDRTSREWTRWFDQWQTG